MSVRRLLPALVTWLAVWLAAPAARAGEAPEATPPGGTEVAA